MNTQEIINKATVSRGIVRIAIEARPGQPVTAAFERELTVQTDSGQVLSRTYAGDVLADLTDNPDAIAAIETLAKIGAALVAEKFPDKQ